MTLPNPTVTHCMHCSTVIRDERSVPNALYSVRYDECATCRAKIQNRVGHPPVKADLPPSLPSLPKAAASPVPDHKPSLETLKIDGRDVECVMVPIEGVAFFPTYMNEHSRGLDGPCIIEIDGYATVRLEGDGRCSEPRGAVGFEKLQERAQDYLDKNQASRGDEP